MNLQPLKQQIILLVNSCNNELLLQNLLEVLSFKEDEDLTKACMLISEKSLAKGWEKEDDEHWNAFLKD